MGFTDHTRKVYDPQTDTNMMVLSVFHWDEEKEKAYKTILRLIGLKPGWRRSASQDGYSYSYLIGLIIERRPESRPFMAKLLRKLKKQNARPSKR